jgi:MbtH protein
MSRDERTEEANYKVVVNEAGLYSIWPADRENAFGWQDAGKTGTAAEVLAYIGEALTDTQPRGLQAEEAGDALRGDREDTRIYKVVVNHEEQFSIWPADREDALGWNDAGKSGTKQECLAYIQEVWTDMRPLSLRKKMEEAERRRRGQ